MSTSRTRCRFCSSELSQGFVDLGSSPLCQKHIPLSKANEAESFYPLHALVCTECYLVQLGEFVVPAEIFGDGEYAYFSSYSDTWVNHARSYAELMTQRFSLDSKSLVVEIASNDGYLLQNFVQRGIPCLGVEPASNCAQEAQKRGVESWVVFFGKQTANNAIIPGE